MNIVREKKTRHAGSGLVHRPDLQLAARHRDRIVVDGDAEETAVLPGGRFSEVSATKASRRPQLDRTLIRGVPERRSGQDGPEERGGTGGKGGQTRQIKLDRHERLAGAGDEFIPRQVDTVERQFGGAARPGDRVDQCRRVE